MAGYLPQQLQDYGGGELANALDFIGWNQKRKYNEGALQAQRINQDMGLEDLNFEKQNNPLRIRRSELDNRGLEYLLPAKQVEGEEAKRRWQVRQGVPVEDEITAAKMKLAKEISADELDRSTNEIKRFIQDPTMLNNPKAQELMQQMYDHLYDVRKMREGFQSKEDIEAMKQAARVAASKEVAERQLAIIKARAEAVKAAAAQKGPKGYQEAATRYRILAEEAESPETRANYMTLAAEFERAAQEQARAGRVGGIDAGAVADLPTTTVSPQLGSGAAPKTMPYASADAVKEAFKAGKITREEATKTLREQFGMK